MKHSRYIAQSERFQNPEFSIWSTAQIKSESGHKIMSANGKFFLV